MGNICGKSESENFSSPGRTVGAPPAGGPPKSSSVPAKAKVSSGPGRTLGGGGAAEGQSSDDARSRAAEAAEARAKAANKPGGKLKSQLAAQKQQTRWNTLNEASNEVVMNREAEDAARARNWD